MENNKIYGDILKSKFINRPNRFIGEVVIDSDIEKVHIKNTGRCKELLLKNSDVFLESAKNPNRKTKYDLISVYKGEKLINIDSQAPNKVIRKWLENKNKVINNIKEIKSEFKYGDSRIDFYIETEQEKILIEVKGVTLENDNIAMFPDAPTERGTRHIKELMKSIEEGYKAYIIFVVQFSGAKYFTCNYNMDKKFSEALKQAKNKGVNIIALDCVVTENDIFIDKELEVRF